MDAASFDAGRLLPPVISVLEARLKSEPGGSAAGIEEYTDWGKSVVQSLVRHYVLSAFSFVLMSPFCFSLFSPRKRFRNLLGR
jgi:hypothetical protein